MSFFLIIIYNFNNEILLFLTAKCKKLVWFL